MPFVELLARRIYDDGGTSGWDFPATLLGVVHQSLVYRVDHAFFSMHTIIRQYAYEKLKTEAGDDLVSIAATHATYYLTQLALPAIPFTITLDTLTIASIRQVLEISASPGIGRCKRHGWI